MVSERMSRYLRTGEDNLSHAPLRSAWLGFMPVAALEDRLRQVRVETEEGVEVEEEEDGVGDVVRYSDLPIVFNCPRHKQETDKVELITQVSPESSRAGIAIVSHLSFRLGG